jgi:hypothetical protein
MTRQKKTTRGGARPGAGRPAVYAELGRLPEPVVTSNGKRGESPRNTGDWR